MRLNKGGARSSSNIVHLAVGDGNSKELEIYSLIAEGYIRSIIADKNQEIINIKEHLQ